MNKFILLLFVLNVGCNSGNLTVHADLPPLLNEVSGIETTPNSEFIWMLNDGGNKSRLFGLDPNGKIKKELKIHAKNHDWEDLASDKAGNLYIGDFGNNLNTRKNLAILKVHNDSLNNSGKIEVERISFSFENQKKFPPKKKQLYFDCEAFFHHNDSLYLFTKSRVKHDFGKTNLYKVPAKQGHHVAKLLGSFNACSDLNCRITSADISEDGNTVALLTLNSVWIFTDFKNDAFLSGKAIRHDLGFESQKESVCFKDNETLYIADEKAHGKGGFLYSFKLKSKAHFKG